MAMDNPRHEGSGHVDGLVRQWGGMVSCGHRAVTVRQRLGGAGADAVPDSGSHLGINVLGDC